MTDLTAIRVALAANLSTVPDCTISPYLLASPGSPALQVVGPREFEYGTTYEPGAGDDLIMVLEGCVPAVLDRGSFELFDKWIVPSGAHSVKAALESDKTLGGACADLRIERFNGYQRTSLQNGTEALTGEWEVRILT